MPDVQHVKVDPNWPLFTNSDEDQRLEVLAERIERKKAILAESYAEMAKIRQRVIKRMRRAQGKT